MRTLITTLSLLLLATCLMAQQGLYIAPGARLQVSKGDALSIYGNVVNEGAFGSTLNSIINFYGKSWMNKGDGVLPDESTNGFSGKGGKFRFSGNNPLYGNLGSQQLFGGYNTASHTGATFPNLDVNNRLGIMLLDLSDVKVRNNLHFTTGHIFLNGWNLVVGNGNPGTITGYNEQAFVITGTAIAGGFLYRERLGSADGKVVFPIGTSTGGYAPVAVEYSGMDDFRARVFDSVYQFAISGLANKLDFTNKTWNLGHLGNAAEARLTLQHMNADEGADYKAYRAASYVTRFMNNTWDYVENPEIPPMTGNLTTTGSMGNATMHIRYLREGLQSNEYFTKASVVYGPYAPAVFIYFNAYRQSEQFAQLEWSVSRELNNERFIIERRFDSDTGFVYAGELRSAAASGNTNTRIDYVYPDPNTYEGWTYYRIRSRSSNGRESFSQIKAVPPYLRVKVWPNPSMGDFSIEVRGQQNRLVLQVAQLSGVAINQYRINGDAQISIKGLPRGTYLLYFYDERTNRLMRTEKVIVIDRKR